MAYSAYIDGKGFFRTDSYVDTAALLSASIETTLGSAGSMTIEVPNSNNKYDKFNLVKGIITVYRDSDLIFEGRVASLSKNFDLTLTVVFEGLLAYLNDSVCSATTYESAYGTTVINDILTEHNSMVETSKQINLGTINMCNDDSGVYISEEFSMEKSISRIQTLVDNYGGFFSVRRTNGKLYLDWVSEDDLPVADQPIYIGENLINLEQSSTISDIVTRLIPLGSDDLTIESVNGGLNYIESSTGISKYTTITDVVSWSDIEDASTLLSYANTYLEALSMAYTEITVTAIDLAHAGYDVGHFSVGTKIILSAPLYGINEQEFTCLSHTINLLDPTADQLQLNAIAEGVLSKTTARTKNAYKSISDMKKTYATKSYVNDRVKVSGTKLIIK